MCFIGVQELGREVFRVPVFTPDFCDRLVSELKHFQSRGIPYDSPNSMNRYGVVLDELLDMSQLFSVLRKDYLQPLARSLFPQHSDIELDRYILVIMAIKN